MLYLYLIQFSSIIMQQFVNKQTAHTITDREKQQHTKLHRFMFTYRKYYQTQIPLSISFPNNQCKK